MGEKVKIRSMKTNQKSGGGRGKGDVEARMITKYLAREARKGDGDPRSGEITLGGSEPGTYIKAAQTRRANESVLQRPSFIKRQNKGNERMERLESGDDRGQVSLTARVI